MENDNMEEFMRLVKMEQEFYKEGKYDEALKASADLAELCGVPKDKILRTINDIDKYFLGE